MPLLKKPKATTIITIALVIAIITGSLAFNFNTKKQINENKSLITENQEQNKVTKTEETEKQKNLTTAHYLNTDYGFSVDFYVGNENANNRQVNITYSHILQRDSSLTNSNLPLLEFTDHAQMNLEAIKYAIYKDKSFLNKAKKIKEIDLFGKKAEVYFIETRVYEYFENIPGIYYIVFNVKDKYLSLKIEEELFTYAIQNKTYNVSVQYKNETILKQYEDIISYLLENSTSLKTFRFLDKDTVNKQVANWPNKNFQNISIPIPPDAEFKSEEDEENTSYFSLIFNNPPQKLEENNVAFAIFDATVFYKSDPDTLTEESLLEAVLTTYITNYQKTPFEKNNQNSSVEKVTENIYKIVQPQVYSDIDGTYEYNLHFYILIDFQNKKVIKVDLNTNPLMFPTVEAILKNTKVN